MCLPRDGGLDWGAIPRSAERQAQLNAQCAMDGYQVPIKVWPEFASAVVLPTLSPDYPGGALDPDDIPSFNEADLGEPMTVEQLAAAFSTLTPIGPDPEGELPFPDDVLDCSPEDLL